MNLIIRWILFAVLMMVIANVIPGISILNFSTAMIVVVVISLINIFIKPIISFISMPINIMTFGIFSLIINTLLLLLAAKISPGFTIDNFLHGFEGALILAIFTPIIDRVKIKK